MVGRNVAGRRRRDGLSERVVPKLYRVSRVVIIVAVVVDVVFESWLMM